MIRQRSMRCVRTCFPRSVRAGLRKSPIRIWVPGCATGEEVYSVAIAVLEYFGDGLPPLGIQIFGTDVSEAALEKARAGVYHINTMQEVSAQPPRAFLHPAKRWVPHFKGRPRISVSSHVKT